MKESKALRITIITIVLLVLCNLSLIAILWLKPGPPPRPNNESPRNFLIKNLQFGESQIKQYDSLIAIHQSDMRILRDESKNLREQLFSKFGVANNNQSLIDSITHQIGLNQAKIESVTFSHFNNVRTICTAGQKTDFDKIIGDLLKSMGQNERPGRDRNDGEHHPPHGSGRPDGPPPPGGPDDRPDPPPPPPGGSDDRPGPPPQQ